MGVSVPGGWRRARRLLVVGRVEAFLPAPHQSLDGLGSLGGVPTYYWAGLCQKPACAGESVACVVESGGGAGAEAAHAVGSLRAEPWLPADGGVRW